MANAIDQKVDQFFSKYPARSYPKGQILVFGGEDLEHIYYLTKGQVRMYDVSYKGDEVIVNIFKPGAFFPMSWAINGNTNPYFYKTETETTLHIVPPEDAVKFIKSNPDVLFDLLARVYSGIDGLLARLVHLMSGSAKERLLYELVVECDRFGKQQKDGSYLLASSEVDLAARSGLSRETISREIHKIMQHGNVSISKKGIVVKNLDSLKSILKQSA